MSPLRVVVRPFFLSILALYLAHSESLVSAFAPIGNPSPISYHQSSIVLFSSTRGKATRPRRRDRILKKLGIRLKGSSSIAPAYETESSASLSPPQTFPVTDNDELETYFSDEQRRFRKENGEDIDYRALLKALDVKGATQIIGDPNRPDYTHPAAQILHQRKREGKEGRTDRAKVALAIEGGGMRGCITAGMVCAVHHLNLTDCFDVVYGSSAGTVVGAYLITGQLPWFGPEVYYDCLTSAGREFIDSRRLLRALGYGLLDPRLLKDVLTRPDFGKPVLNLDYLLQTTLQNNKKLDWDKFVEKQKTLPLKIVVSDLKDEKARVMDMEGGYFNSLAELANCMHASCLLPGIAGPMMNVNTQALGGDKKKLSKFFVGNDVDIPGVHPLADALVYEPLPYRSAVEEGATHVVVLRSRPDGVDVTGKSSLFEKMIMERFFLRKNRLPKIFQRMTQQRHKKLYAENVLELNKDAYNERSHDDTSSPHLLTVATPPGTPEVVRLELRRETIFEGMRNGFARAYDCLVEDPAERGRGAEVAKEYFPDEILEYDPLEISAGGESAFAYYKRVKEASSRR